MTSKPNETWDLPPPASAELRKTPLRHREDAKAEAYLAIVEGRNPRNAIQTYNAKWKRWESRP